MIADTVPVPPSLPVTRTLAIARQYVAAGLSVVPIKPDGSKHPGIAWQVYQRRLATDVELRVWFGSGRNGIGIVCGLVSGGLEVIDHDSTLLAAWERLVETRQPGLIARLPLVQTPSGGAHVYARCATIAGNLKLAQIGTAAGERKTAIETRGEGGLVVAPGSPAACHPSGRLYTVLRGDLRAVPVLDASERDLLLSCARTFGAPANEPVSGHPPAPGRPPAANGKLRPGDAFGLATSWGELLEPYGWSLVLTHGQTACWRRPGKPPPGWSATTNHAGSNLLYVFSSNAAPFEAEHSYTPFAAYALLAHSGDFGAAARALAEQGYGEPAGTALPVDLSGPHELGAGGTGTGTGTEDTRPVLDAGEKDLPVITGQTWTVLLAANAPPSLFRHGSVPVRLEQDDEGAPIVRELTPERLRYELGRLARWETTSTRDGVRTRRPALPPQYVVADVLATPDPPLPILTRIVEAPVFGPDGSLGTEPGYHQAGGTYYAPVDGVSIPGVDAQPSASDVDAARGLLCDDLLGEFPFVGDAERANAVGLLLLPFVRDLIAGPTPLHLIEAPSAGSGKGLLADILSYPAAGRSAGLMTEAREDDEWRKRITTVLREGRAVVVLDNLHRPLVSAALAAALTATTWEDRLLGSNELIRAPVRCAWVATANNPTVSTELARRCVRIRIDPRVDRPWERNGWKHPDLRQWVAAHRGRLIWASLTLVRAWLDQRCPSPQRLGSYERWADVIGGILTRANIQGFLANRDEFYAIADTEGTVWRQLVLAWWEQHQSQAIGTAELFALALELDFDLGKGTERAQKTAFGMQLARQRDRIIAGYRIESAGSTHRVKQWRLRPTAPAGSGGVP